MILQYIYCFYCHTPHKGELLSSIIVYKFEHLIQKGNIYVLKVVFLSQDLWIEAEVTHHHSCQNKVIQNLLIPMNATATFNILNFTLRYIQSHITSISISNNRFWNPSHLIDLHHSQRSLLTLLASLGSHTVQTAIGEHQLNILKVSLAKPVHLDITPINSIWHLGLATMLYSNNLQVLPSCTTFFYSTWHQASKQVPVQANDFHIIGHCDRNIHSPEVVKVGQNCSPLRISLDNTHYFTEYLAWLQP